MMNYYLTVYIGSKVQNTICLNEQKGFVGGRITFGRAQDNDIVLSYPTVSRSHGAIEFVGEKVYMTDSGSLNKLSYKGKQYTKVPLRDRMLISLSPGRQTEESIRLYFTAVQAMKPTVATEEGDTNTQGYAHAEIGRRITALAIDLFIIFFMWIGAMVLLLFLDLPFKMEIGVFCIFPIWILYFALSDSSDKQGTAGKKVAGILVASDEGIRISIKSAYIRSVMKLVSILILGIGFAPIFSSGKTLHDAVAKTNVFLR